MLTSVSGPLGESEQRPGTELNKSYLSPAPQQFVTQKASLRPNDATQICIKKQDKNIIKAHSDQRREVSLSVLGSE